MLPNRHSAFCRGAYTLAEMLIVITIMVMLVAVTLPVAKKVMDGSQGREASRQLNGYFAMVKSRALQTGRPCGIYFSFSTPPGFTDQSANLTTTAVASYWPVRQVTQLYMAEIPPPYSGGTTTAVARMDSSSGLVLSDTAGGTNEPTYLQSLLTTGEQFLIRFNFKGDWYICRNASTTSTPSFTYLGPLQSTAQPPVQPYGFANSSAPGVPFQILRSPKIVGNAMTLPNGTCIDVAYCGVGNSYRTFKLPDSTGTDKLVKPPTGLYVMFSPTGGVDSMYLDSTDSSNKVRQGIPLDPPLASLFFLVGKIEKVSDPTASTSEFANLEISNLADPTSLWVVVNRGTGQVTTAENMPDKTQTTLANYVKFARQAAIYGEQMGGR